MRTIVARALPVVLAVGAAGVALALPTALLGDRAGAPRSRPAPAAEAPIVIRLATPPSAPRPRPASPRPVRVATPATLAARTTPPAIVALPRAPAHAQAVPAPPAASKPKARRRPARPPVTAPAPVPAPPEPVQQAPSVTIIAEPAPQPQPEVRSLQNVLPAPPVAEAGNPADTGADAHAHAGSTPKEHGNATHRADGTPGNGEHGRGRVRT